MRYLYILVIYLFLPVVLARLFLRGMQNRSYFRRVNERFGRYNFPPRRYDIWIHAVSVGEVNAAGPLARAMIRRYPGKQILLTTMTPTGADQAKLTMGNKIDHLYLPYDYPPGVRSFLDHTNPKLAIMIETEIWPNIVAHCKKRKIPLIVANLRLSQGSHKSYARFLPFTRSVFRNIKHFAVQTNADRLRVEHLSKRQNNITVTGNIKFEVSLPASLKEVAQVIRREWGTERTIIVAGSTHEKEEEIIIDAFKPLRETHPELLLVVVPRHPERFDSVYRLLLKSKLKTLRRSRHSGDIPRDVAVFLGDSMGELPTFYAAADIAVVGGSLVPIGGHNILEPCALGKPVVFGQYMFNFLEISKMALQRKAGIQISSTEELEQILLRFTEDANFRFSYGQNGVGLVEDNRGALDNTMTVLESTGIFTNATSQH